MAALRRILGRGRLRRLRHAMRGYRLLKQRAGLTRIPDLLWALAADTPDVRPGLAAKLIFGSAPPGAVLRQYLLIRVGGLGLNKAILASVGRPGRGVVHPLPPRWRGILAAQGFPVDTLRSALAWRGYVFLLWAYGVLTIARHAARSASAMLSPPPLDDGPYAYFVRLSKGNLPQPAPDGRSHDVITWYARWPARRADLASIRHGVAGAAARTANGVPVITAPALLPPITRPAALGRFVLWGVAAAVVAAGDLARGGWFALMLSEAASSAVVRFGDPRRLAAEYLFHNSDWIYRPLWSYEAEARGSRILFYFYSTNCDTFKRSEGYPLQGGCWHAMNWPEYLVWDDEQRDFVHRAVGHRAVVHVVGPIWFQASPLELAPLPARAVAVFDVQPHREASYRMLGQPLEYYTPVTACAFLADTQAAAADLDAVVVLKRKRHIGRAMHPRYRVTLDRLQERPNFVSVEPELSPHRVIERSSAVVSMPFTSTALLARAMGKPSVYYDPFGVVQKDDRASHGIPILAGRAELAAWMQDALEDRAR